jgi:hypothetical protein
MASHFDTHITISARRAGTAGPAPALGRAAVVMSRWGTARVGRTRRGLDTDGMEALLVRCART